MEIILTFLSFTIFTAVLFFKIGRDYQRKSHDFIVKYVVNDIYETCAAEFYPGDPDGKTKVSRRMAMRAMGDLRKMTEAGL